MDRPRNRARKPGNVRLRRRKDNPAPLCTRTSSQPCDRVKDLQKKVCCKSVRPFGMSATCTSARAQQHKLAHARARRRNRQSMRARENDALLCSTQHLHSMMATLLPSYLPTSLPSYLPTFLPSYLPTFLPSYLPTFLSSYLPTFLLYLTANLPSVDRPVVEPCQQPHPVDVQERWGAAPPHPCLAGRVPGAPEEAAPAGREQPAH